ncbi:metalloregulator ArsR/SmtB family transcription factor [Actinoplanes sp. TRM 88003]|uniref:Metalloregulator ArsR/SmtB family transcription factor n=1 Tax=Paractinoplanes aksuensis TaxID=2939490 RepID=A0ABT1DKL8_9ACTN|nr:metalloregulator ArsR/SmtB family transcription factor [Actinoplanes aksuensis]MCO8270580.1 metalloregulator ArsR/SmtB family transcription factor [Actinoplanes aksuensis]
MDDVVAALADPVRRVILEVLRGGPLPARLIAGRFPISRPAVSRHLRVLRECGLVHDTAEGRERVYRLDPAPLTAVKTWLAGFPDSAADVWSRRLDALETEVYRTRRDHREAALSPATPKDADQEERTA